MFDDSRSAISTVTTLVGVLLIVSSVLGAMGGALAADPVVDTETTDTSTESEVVEGSTISGFEASADNDTYVEASSMTDNGSVKVMIPDRNLTLYTNSSLVATNSSQGYYAATIPHEKLAYLPVESGENRTVTIRLVNNTDVDNPGVTNVTVNVHGVEGRSVYYVDDSKIGSDALVSTVDTGVSVFGTTILEGATETKFTDESVAINGSNSTVIYHFANDTSAESFDTSLGDVSDGERTTNVLFSVDGEPIKPYVGNAPDDVNQSSTYAVYKPETDTLRVHFGDDYEGADSAQVFVSTDAGLFSGFTFYTLGSFDIGMPSLMGLLGAGLTAAGRGLAA